MKKIIYILFLVVTGSLYSQSTWCKIYGGPMDDQNYSTNTTKDSKILVVGEIRIFKPSSGQYILQTCLTKFDLDGSIIWQKFIGDSAFSNYPRNAVEDPSGNFFLPVISSSYPELYKFSPNGNILWSRQYSDSLIWMWLYAQLTSDNRNLIISGLNQDLFYKLNLTKIDTSGNILNYKALFTEDSNHAYSGGGFIIKDSSIFLAYGPGSGSTFVSHIGKFDLNFNQVWKIDIPPGYGTYNIISISDRSILGLGYHWNPFHMYINKFDVYGNILWGKEYDSLYHDKGIVKTLKNEIAVCGRANYDTAKFTILDTLGNVIKVARQPSTSNTRYDYLGMTQSIDSGYVLVGTFNNSNFADCLVVKTDKDGNTVPLGINKKNEIPQSFLLHQNYPNPFNPTTKISFGIPVSPLYERGAVGFIKLVIFDILGKEVEILVDKNLKPGKYSIEWSPKNLPSGIYFCSMYVDDKIVQSIKLILLK